MALRLDEPDKKNDLKYHLKRLRKRNSGRKYFIPETAFLSLMSEEAIRQALAESAIPQHHWEEIAPRIVQYGKKIFGILVLLDHTALVNNFIEADQFEDAKLPFKIETLRDDINLQEEEAQDFEERQWELMAPTFCRGTLHRRLGEGAILPFLSDRRIGGGAFGTVYEVALDVTHQPLDRAFPENVGTVSMYDSSACPLLIMIKFARKEFQISDDHHKELENLAILNHLKHPNIVELLSSYTHNDKHNLLFPLAKSGSLANLLKAERNDTAFASDESMVFALAALTSAVQHVHDFFESKMNLRFIGCHHDLRPRNILISDGTFILADFGLSTFKQTTRNSATPFKPVTDDYLAPECEDWDNGFQGGTVTRSSDIWSLGCIIAEVATYMAFGHQGVAQFVQVREHKVGAWTLSQFHHGPKKLSAGVESWLEKVQQSPSVASTLMASIARKALCLNPADRPKAAELCARIRLAALYMVGLAIDDLFKRIMSGNGSLDMFLEHARFNSWRYAMTIDRPEMDVVTLSSATLVVLQKFDAALNCLTRLRDDLDSRLSRGQDTQRLDLSLLTQLNDELMYFLGQEQKDTSQRYFSITLMENNDGLFDKVTDSNSGLTLDYEIRMRSNIKHISHLFAGGAGTESRALQVDASKLQISGTFGEHNLGVFTEGESTRPVWIEWRKYAQHGSDEHVMEQLFGRAARLTELFAQERPKTFRTLRATGFFHEASRGAFGVVFDTPTSSPTTGSLDRFSLQKMIEKTASKTSLWPDLDDRFALASAVAGAILEFHAVGWVHKAITPSKIVFFPKANAGHEGIIREPFLVGFDHSRPDDPLSFTSGMAESAARHYTHPTYLKQRFGYQAQFDYYSLGMILLEIGFWSPLAKITHGWTGSFEDRRKKLLADRVPRLRQHMGKAYFEAVRDCIECDFGAESLKGNDTVSSRETLLQFEKRVVGRLQRPFSGI